MPIVPASIGQPEPRTMHHHARRSPRHVLVAAATLWDSNVPDGTAGTRVSILNVSLEGVAFRARVPFEPDQVYYVRMIAGPLHLEGPIRVAWCRKHDATSFEIGAIFIGRK
ncbi:MAG: PilZ domain-containing protein [Bacillota bacterium]